MGEKVAEPELLLIPHEDFEYTRFSFVGRYGDGNQFMAFVTGAFPKDWWSGNYPPEYLRGRWAEHKRWYAVLHRFGPGGDHLGTEARSGGTTAEGQAEAIDRAERELAVLLASVAPFRPCGIRVKLFGVEIDGYYFGLDYKCVDAEDPENPSATDEYVMLEPNDIMFHPPWDSGEYST
jgi:formate hydrogenlyase regulatory protein HycA